jgi:lysyl-tRNA synthetase, class II
MSAERVTAMGARENGSRVSRRVRIRPEAVPAFVGTACALIGFLNVAAGIFPRYRHSRMHHAADVIPGTVSSFAVATSVVAGILMLMLAHALKRGKRRAWRAAVVLLPVSAVAEVLRRHSPFGAVIALAVTAVLIVYRDQFFARADPRTRWRALSTFLWLSVLSMGLGLLVVSAHSQAVMGDASWAARFQEVVYGLFGFQGPIHYRTDQATDVVAFTLGGLGFLIAFTTVYLALRPAKPVAELTPDDEGRLRELLARHGSRDSLGHFALRRDKSVVFSPSGKAAVCYRVVAGVMLASGDPIGDVEAWPGAIERFMAEARAHAWIPAVAGCSETGGEVWTRETGLDALEMGDEAVVDASSFSLSGRAMRNVRQMVKRIERAGYECKVQRVSELSDEERDTIRRVSDAWRGTETERGFSMALGRFGDAADGDCVVATAHDADGELRAVQHYVPWGTDGMSLELMRRDRAADPGLNELLIVAALQRGPEMGVKRVSLNFAMFRSALARGERLGAGPVLRTWRHLLVFLSRWFQIESLYKFNAKFQPEWLPRFVVFRKTSELPRVGLAYMEAEGFITFALPGWARRFRRAA